MRRLGTVVRLLLVTAAATACTGANGHHAVLAAERSPSDGSGALVLRLGPGAPGASAASTTLLTLRIEAIHPPTGQAGTTLRTDVTALLNQPVTVHLSPGSYKVTSTDGKACATGISVDADATVTDDLAYPFAGCQQLGPPSR